MIRRLKASQNPLKQLQDSSTSLLSLLIKGTEGDASLAEHELRWLQEHVDQLHPTKPKEARVLELWKLCQRRASLEPLQLILGSQPFGDLEIKCKKGVLIPRSETESYTIHLARLLNSGTLSEILRKQFAVPTIGSKVETQTDTPPQEKSQDQELNTAAASEEFEASNSSSSPSPYAHDANSTVVPRTLSKKDGSNVPSLNILDICSGSGCISLLLHSLLSKKFPNLKIRGWDISKTAFALANQNLEHNIEKGYLDAQARDQVLFQRLNIFDPQSPKLKELDDVDIIISNPPYISSRKLLSEATQSVRDWEPRLALVPYPKQQLKQDADWPSYRHRPEDVFYAQLLYLHGHRRRCRALIMEIGDQEQAIRLVKMALRHVSIATTNRIEIWRDFPDQQPEAEEESSVEIWGKPIPVVGSGSIRSVVLVLQTLKDVDGSGLPERRSESLERAPRVRKKTDKLDPIYQKYTGNKTDPVQQLIDRKMRMPKRRMV